MDSDDAGHWGAADEAEHDWAGIKQAYCEGELRLNEIEERFGVNRRSIYYRIEREDWPRRRPEGTGGRSDPERMLRRLKFIVNERIAEFEAEIGGASSPRSAADLERETRSLAALVKLMEKIVELETAARNARNGGARRWSNAELDRRRSDLAKKLVAMLEQERGRPLR